MPSKLLGTLITSKTRLKLLSRFVINQNLSGYLQGLSKELEENTNSIRVELNRLEEAGMLSSSLEGRRKLYCVNTLHPLASDITSIIRKVAGIDAVIDRVVENLPGLKQVWICGDLARGIPSNSIDCILVGEEFDTEYIAGLSGKVYKLVAKKVNTQVMEEISRKRWSAVFYWSGIRIPRMISRLKTAIGVSNSEKQSKIMLVKSYLENCMKEKIAHYG